jgi:hypothetical protein
MSDNDMFEVPRSVLDQLNKLKRENDVLRKKVDQYEVTPNVDLGNESYIIDYCKRSGAMTVWRSWRDTMLKYYREVDEDHMNWFSVPDRDKSLDAYIAYAVVKDFLEWLGEH